MTKHIVMSGMRPTGKLHLGHWEGALKEIEKQTLEEVRELMKI